jgi:Chalcone isomerase-like
MHKIIVFSLLWLLSAPAAAVELPTAACNLLQTCRLIGQGQLRWWGFHVYDAALWSPTGRWQAQAPYALDIRYARRVTGVQLADTSVDELRRLGIGDEAALTRWGAAMRKLFPDVAPGSRLIGVHVPQRGALFYSATGYLGAIEEPEFARGFFAIWLDPRTQKPDLRAALLGRDAPAQ